MPKRAPRHNPFPPIPGARVHTPKARPTGRNADPRRAIPLNSTRWQKLRARILAEEPLCRMCNEPATDVDHVSGDPGDNTRGNLQPLCHACHSYKTGRERAGRPVEVRGCDTYGWPLDPAHPWNQEEKSLEAAPAKTARPPFLHRNGRG